MGGATGLDYAALYPLLDRHFTEPTDWQQAFEDVGQMELAALAAMRGEPLPGTDDPDADPEDDDEDPSPDP